MSSIPSVILHYQKSIEKSDTDRARLLHCIAKLYKLPITVQHLQETGIGRTVNSLRKDDGEVGVAAKALVAKWKAMVAAEESSDDNENAQQDEVDDDMSPNSRRKHTVKVTVKKEKISHEKEAKRMSNVFDSDDHRKTSNSDSSSSHHGKHSRALLPIKKEKENNTSSDELDYVEGNRLVIDTNKKSQSHKVTTDSNHTHDVNPKSNHKSNNETSSSRKTDHSHHSKEHHSNHHRTSSNDHKHASKTTDSHHSSSSSSHKKTSKSSSSSSSNKEKNVKESTSSSRKDGKQHSSSSTVKQETIHENGGGGGGGGSRHSGDKKSSSKHHLSSSNSKHSHHTKETTASVSGGDSKHSASSHHEPTHTSTKASTSGHHKSSSSSNHNKHASPPAKKIKLEVDSENDVDEIDSSMGTSFADALGMIVPTTSKSKQKSSQRTSTTSSSSMLATSPSTSKVNVKVEKVDVKAEKSDVKLERSLERNKSPPTITPALLTSTVKLEPLEPELSLELPSISNNYRPMPLNPIVMDCVFKNNNQPPPKRTMTDEEFGATISSKTMRTKVYSGIKSGALLNVPSLFVLCIRVLQKNIDALEYTGGVPYSILQPVLERTTPQQLFTMEHHNPYLIDDTDKLWQQHCNRKFRGKKREELETWRDMFLRCTEEQNTRLSHLTTNIKRSQAVAVPVKKTKIAFVDSLVKPPRNVIRKQHQYGTESKLVATPAARVPTLNSSMVNIGRLGDTRLKVLAGTRDTAQASSSSSASFRPKKAPLMAKTIQYFKGRFKR